MEPVSDKKEETQEDKQPTNIDPKLFMYSEFIKQYQSFSALINNIPFHPALKQLIIQHIDTGYLWAKEGFTHLLETQQAISKEPEQEQNAA